ncbi:MAG: sugar ABC transporter substrate-binding protein [Armatimonadetes bacterium]|nr:sugar ABC transporter substrate-binding protein [Armatimonadota bacterium]
MGLRRLGLAGVLAGMALTTGCLRMVGKQAPRRPPARPATLTFAYWSVEAREVAVVEELVARFETQHPDIRIRTQDVPARYYEKLMAQFAADQPPDVFILNYGRLGDFARRGLLADLSPMLSADATLGARDFVPTAFEAFRSVGDTIGRPGLYALPRDWGPTGLLVYDKSAFEAAGIGLPGQGWTWDDFAGACRKLTVRSPNGEVTRYGGSVNLYPYSLLGWFRQNGGEVVSPDGTLCTFDAPACVGAVEFIASLSAAGVILPPDPTQDESVDAFVQGRTAMALVTPHAFGKLRECTDVMWGVAPPLTGKRRGCGCIPSGVAISARCREPRLAYTFARSWVTEGARAYAESGLAVPAYLPALNSAALERGMGAEPARIVRAATPLAQPYPVSATLAYEDSLAALREALEKVFLVGESPEAALKAAAARANKGAATPAGT